MEVHYEDVSFSTSTYGTHDCFKGKCWHCGYLRRSNRYGEIEVEDNYVNSREVAAAAFWSAAIFEGAHLRTTICDLNENRYVIIKKTNQAALDATDTLTMVFPVPSSQRGQRP